MTTRARLARATATAATGTALSRVTGVLRMVAVVGAIGVAENRLADVYAVANVTSNVLYELLAGGILTSVFVPLFVDLRTRGSEKEAWEGASAVAGCALAVLTAIAALGVMFAPWIYRAYTLGGGPENAAAQAAGTTLVRWIMPQVVFYGAAAIAGGLLAAYDRFGASAFAPTVNNLAVTAAFLAYPILFANADVDTVSNNALAWIGAGTTLGVALLAAVHLPALRAVSAGRLRLRVRFRHPAVRQLLRMGAWTFGYVVVNQIGLLLATNLAYAAGTGGAAAYQYAFVFFQLPHGVLAVSIATVLLPRLAAAASHRDQSAFLATFREGARMTFVLVLPAAIGLALIARPVVGLFTQFGVGTAASTELVADILSAFAVGLVPFSLFQFVLRALYARQDTRSPLLVNVIAVAVNMVANIAFYPSLDVRGLAFGHATAYTVALVLGLWALRRQTGPLQLGGLRRTVLGAGAAGVLLAVAVVVVDARLDHLRTGPGLVLRVAVDVVVGLLLYVGVTWRLRLLRFAASPPGEPG